MSAARWAPKPLGGGDCVCVCVFMKQPAYILPVCALAAGVFSAASVPERSHAYCRSPVHFFFSKYASSMFQCERLNNAQRDRHNEWMRVRLPLANFLYDLLRSTVPPPPRPVAASWDTRRHTNLPPPPPRRLRTVTARAEFLKANTD